MAINGLKIISLAKKRGIKAKDFKAAVYPERTGAFSWREFRAPVNPKASAIEAMANILGCSIDELFDRQTAGYNHVTGNNNTVGNVNINTDDAGILRAQLNVMQDIVRRQDKQIAQLNQRIDQLIELVKKN